MLRFLLGSFCLLIGSAGVSPNVSAKPIVATIWPLKFLCDGITAKPEQCDVLLDPGLSPHTYEPKPSQLKQLKDAKLFLTVGGAMDPWAVSFAKDVKHVAVLDLMPQDKLLTSTDPHIVSGSKDKPAYDPHFWLDPTMMRTAVGVVTPVLCSEFPENCDGYKKNAAKWQDSLLLLSLELEKQLRPVQQSPFLIYHPFLDYFVAKFHLQQVAKIEPESGHEPGPQHLSQVLQVARKTGARTIVVSPQIPLRAVKVVAESLKMQTVSLDDIGGSDGRKTYQDLMRYNVTSLERALKAKTK